MNERILLRRDPCSSFSLASALVSPYIFCSSVFQSLSVSFFILLDATFAFVHRARWLLFLFFFSTLLVPYGILVSFIFVVRPLIFPYAYAALCPRCSRHRFLYCICSSVSFYFSDVAITVLDTFSRFFTYTYMLSYFPLFSRVRPAILRANARDSLRAVSVHFPFRYVRSVSDTWSVLLCLDIVLFCCAKCIPRASLLVLASPFLFRVSSPYSSNFQPLRYFVDGRSLKIRDARFPPITHVNSARSSRAENRKIVGPGKRCSLERESPVKQYSAKFL